GGYFIPEEEPKTNKAKIITLAGGPSFSLLQAILYGIIRLRILEFVQPGSSLHEILLPVSAFLLYFNFFQFLFTVIPIRYRIICRGLESDGLQIIHTLKHNKAQ
ncbi:MAG: hypothetical protein IJG63_07910, partial [Oscillospiraceae bacterium]|nr:hypothetical protein [Oscillospiraceae bacterium]